MNLYTVHGKPIFKNEEELNAHLETDNLKDHFRSIIDPVSSYNSFLEKTGLSYVMTLKFNNMNSMQSSTVENYLRNFRDTDMCLSMTDNQHFLNWNGLDGSTLENGDLMRDILNHMDEDLAYMETKPLSQGTDTEVYSNFMADICFQIFKTHYHVLAAAFPNFISDMNDSSLLMHRTQLIQRVNDHASREPISFINTCGGGNEKSYWENVVDSVKTASSSQGSEPIKKLFLLCFYPYFYFTFLTNSIAKKNSAEINAPRLFLFQRITVLSSYIYIFYTIMTILQIMGSNVISSNYQRAYMMLARFNDSVFSNESYIDEESKNEIQAQVMANGSYKMSGDLKDVNKKIEDMKGNLGRSTFTEHEFNNQIASQKKRLIFWILIVILSITLPIIFLFLSYDTSFFVSWIIIILIVVIGLIMSLLK